MNAFAVGPDSLKPKHEKEIGGDVAMAGVFIEMETITEQENQKV